MAVRATRLGALDFLEKPLSTDKLLLTVENATRLKRLEAENRELRKRVGRHEIVWASDAMRRVMAQVERVAAGESRVCILGETGTGKELIARALHRESPRDEWPLRHAQLRRGSAGADRIRAIRARERRLHGRCRAARRKVRAGRSRNTCFWTKSATCPPSCKPSCCACWKKARSSAWAARAPCAWMCASWWRRIAIWKNRCVSGAFRQDLYHRIFVFPILLPPLARASRRPAVLVDHFARHVSEQNGWKPKPFTPAATKALEGYSWPGNVRELRNFVERLLLLADGEVDEETVHLILPAGGAESLRVPA